MWMGFDPSLSPYFTALVTSSLITSRASSFLTASSGGGMTSSSAALATPGAAEDAGRITSRRIGSSHRRLSPDMGGLPKAAQ